MNSLSVDESIEARQNTESIEITVPENQQRERIDQFLASQLEKISRAQIQKLIQEEKITVNLSPVKSSHQVVGGERIIVTIPAPSPADLLPEDLPLEIIFEDDSLLVLNKKAGMVVHPAFGNKSGTLANALVFHSSSLSALSGKYRPGLVHRLDKDTSGLLVVAKNDFVHARLAQQFSEHTTIREYQALVWGQLSDRSGRIESYICRSQKDRTRMIISDEVGKWAVTNWELIRQYSLVALIRLNLETGRTHQIRVHLSSLGHPVVADQTYGGCKKQIIGLKQQDQQQGLLLLKIMGRQALHAKTLGFVHPVTNEHMLFDSELPADMVAALKFLDEQG